VLDQKKKDVPLVVARDTSEVDDVLQRLSQMKRYPHEALVTYKEFVIVDKALLHPRWLSLPQGRPCRRGMGMSSAATSPTKSGTTDRTRATKAHSKRGGSGLQVVCEGSTPRSFLSSQEALSVSIWAIEIRPI
jgi:hypothetical protein